MAAARAEEGRAAEERGRLCMAAQVRLSVCVCVLLLCVNVCFVCVFVCVVFVPTLAHGMCGCIQVQFYTTFWSSVKLLEEAAPLMGRTWASWMRWGVTHWPLMEVGRLMGVLFAKVALASQPALVRLKACTCMPAGCDAPCRGSTCKPASSCAPIGRARSLSCMVYT